MKAITEIEPQLEKILRMAKSSQSKNRYETYSRCKLYAEEYVGWYANREELRTQEAYRLFINLLCEAVGI